MRLMPMLPVAVAAALILSLPAFAATRTPCSGKKGGVDRCENGKFICKDGSKSASKKMCEMPAKKE